jgi:hypothetical protein
LLKGKGSVGAGKPNEGEKFPTESTLTLWVIRVHSLRMDNVHWLIRTKGIEEACRQAVTKRERQVVEAAYQVMSDDEERIGFSYSGFALTSLPHKPVEGPSWKREGHNLTLLLQSGLSRDEKPVGLPYQPAR